MLASTRRQQKAEKPEHRDVSPARIWTGGPSYRAGTAVKAAGSRADWLTISIMLQVNETRRSASEGGGTNVRLRVVSRQGRFSGSAGCGRGRAASLQPWLTKNNTRHGGRRALVRDRIEELLCFYHNALLL